MFVRFVVLRFWVVLGVYRGSVFSRRRSRDERGDVPGWVMIAVVSAGLAAGLYEVAAPALRGLLAGALAQVRGE